MISLSSITARAVKFASDNSPLILTAIGATGVGATAYLTHKAAFKSAEAIADASSFHSDDEMKNSDKFKLVWINYLPAVGVGALTITSVICANRVSTKRSAALAGALLLANNDFDEYKAKVTEKLGIAKADKISDEVMKDKVKNSQASQIIIAGQHNVLCYDVTTDRFFESNIQDLKTAELDIQRQILNNGYATLTDWYTQIGLKRTPLSDELGWNTDKDKGFEVKITTTEDREGYRPCFAIDFRKYPVREYLQFKSDRDG